MQKLAYGSGYMSKCSVVQERDVCASVPEHRIGNGPAIDLGGYWRLDKKWPRRRQGRSCASLHDSATPATAICGPSVYCGRQYWSCTALHWTNGCARRVHNWPTPQLRRAKATFLEMSQMGREASKRRRRVREWSL